MNQSEVLSLWKSESDMYKAWGEYVADEVRRELGKAIPAHAVDLFIRIPPIPRIKDDTSLVTKALWRGKEYSDPYHDVTDKVGVRFVVLLTSDIEVVKHILESNTNWTHSLDRDYEIERKRDPLSFPYSAVHYVVTNTRDFERPVYNSVTHQNEGIIIKKGIPCEVQIKTLLQHAHSELTHDTVYKPQFSATSEMLRATAKGMALIEATDDYFLLVAKEFNAIVEKHRKASEELSQLYVQYLQAEPSLTAIEGILIGGYLGSLPSDWLNRLTAFYELRPELYQVIAQRTPMSLLYQQPSIVLVYYLVATSPRLAEEKWPYTPELLRPIFSDLGKGMRVTA